MISKQWQHFKHMNLEFWAQNGLIHIIDTRKEPAEHKTECVREFLLRANQFIEDRNRISHKIQIGAYGSSAGVARQEVEKIQTLIEAMIRCTRIAKEQGDPNDPRVQEHIRKHGALNRKLVIPTASQVLEINKPIAVERLLPATARRDDGL
jgi:hypothetical protein